MFEYCAHANFSCLYNLRSVHSSTICKVLPSRKCEDVICMKVDTNGLICACKMDAECHQVMVTHVIAAVVCTAYILCVL